MTGPTVYSFHGSDGTTILRGTITPPPGGGSVPIQAVYTNPGGSTINASSNINVPLTKTSGTDLFDLTDPTNPVVLATGTYAFSGTTGGAGPFQAFFNAQSTTWAQTESLQAGALMPTMAITLDLAAGDVIQLVGQNNDAINPQDMFVTLTFVKIA